MRVWEHAHADHATLPLHFVQRQDKLPRLSGILVVRKNRFSLLVTGH